MGEDTWLILYYTSNKIKLDCLISTFGHFRSLVDYCFVLLFSSSRGTTAFSKMYTRLHCSWQFFILWYNFWGQLCKAFLPCINLHLTSLYSWILIIIKCDCQLVIIMLFCQSYNQIYSHWLTVYSEVSLGIFCCLSDGSFDTTTAKDHLITVL